ncbi:MAG: squalene synthase HpnC [Paludibacterium sp.]|uniref:squalene synthase HpnC n=1 Tax=Paludibacterium sp. TaxID=1917523 RepID=UPI0025DB2AB8|nr:squalene synthase HpnC [Paludibacterium sp.]MBV8047610.1 squalene synthase HpnC [Paludibacterium sp.]MBV8648227.1 squalene synthase HpnC [Paludibacterium sp.]
MSVGHYENFPVGSLLLPRRLRAAVHVIYRFARYADDLADEGDATAAERLAALQALRDELGRIGAGETPQTALMAALASVIAKHALALDPFYDLLSAFEQDVVKTRYENFAEVMDYCRRSANPVGRLMLSLYGETDARSLAMSDGICSALQLINFLQDVGVDWRKGRVYLPQEDLARFRVGEAQIAAGDAGGLWTPMMLKQIERARKLLHAGAPLGKKLHGRIGLELRLIILGGDRILQKLHHSGGNVFTARPVLGTRDWVGMLWRALWAR